jgi:hypothetical protein
VLCIGRAGQFVHGTTTVLCLAMAHFVAPYIMLITSLARGGVGQRNKLLSWKTVPGVVRHSPRGRPPQCESLLSSRCPEGAALFACVLCSISCPRCAGVGWWTPAAWPLLRLSAGAFLQSLSSIVWESSRRHKVRTPHRGGSDHLCAASKPHNRAVACVQALMHRQLAHPCGDVCSDNGDVEQPVTACPPMVVMLCC